VYGIVIIVQHIVKRVGKIEQMFRDD